MELMIDMNKEKKLAKKADRQDKKAEKQRLRNEKRSIRKEAFKKSWVYQTVHKLKVKFQDNVILLNRENLPILEKIISKSGLIEHETYWINANKYWSCFEVFDYLDANSKCFMLSRLNARKNVFVSIDVDHVPASVYDDLSDKIVNASLEGESNSKKMSELFSSKEVTDQNTALFKHIKDTQQSVKKVSLRVYFYADSLVELEKEKGQLNDLFKQLKLKGYIQLNDQRRMYKALTNFDDSIGVMMSSESVADMMMYKELNKINRHVSVIGLTVNGVYAPDFFNFENASYSIVMMGDTGSGKSAAAKLIIEDMILRGDTVQVLDIHKEYVGIAERYGVANPSIDGDSHINLCQIYSVDNIATGVISDMDLSNKISLIAGTISELVDIDKRKEFTMMVLLENELAEMYESYLGKRLEDLKNEDWFIVSDVLKKIEEKKKSNLYDDEAKHDVYKLIGILTKVVKQYGFLYNQVTNIEVDLSKSIIFDISFLKSDQMEKMKGSYLTLIGDFLSKGMSLNWQYNNQMEKDTGISLSKHERQRPFKTLLQVVDEFGQYLSNEAFLKLLERQITFGRKSYAGILLIMHTAEQVLKTAEKNGDLIRSLFNLCVNKVIGSISGTTVSKVMGLVEVLNERDCIQLSELVKGANGERQFLFCDASNVKYWVTTIVTKHQQEYFLGGA